MAKKESHTHGATESLSPTQRLKHFNGMLVFIMIYLAFCAFNFGFDVGTFGGVQAMNSLPSMFGECDDKNGCIACGWIAEKWGRRAAILGICLVSFVGVALQTSATTAAQFTIGRIIAFGMTGTAIVVIPIYSAEVSPKVLRGMFASTIQIMILGGVGSIDAKSINRHEKELVVSFLMLFQFFYSLSWAPCTCVVLSETAALRLKVKTNLFASGISMLTTFVTSLAMTYLINAKYANLGGKAALIYEAINFVMVVATFFFIPELKSGTLEGVDQFFSRGTVEKV
ncbi:hypothetical protein N0V84_011071 [Fusarium piperis]|uniref:Major facilitator superfamily (MFS) profile domain-containing protein n=1 Tax=Fusarium piperis TaxID=1435070 RepID=A0A9W8TBV8_9HYPO|nr:hypothetical protein N0V84_011071 [Fusarium piperis]